MTFTLGYNPAGQLTSRTVSNDSYVFALAAASTAYAANGKNQMVQAGSAVPSWDKKGNLTSDGTDSYTYSSENLLATIANPGPHSTATSLSYDPLGRLREIGSNFSGFWEQLVEDQAGQVAFEVQTLSRTVRSMFGSSPDEILVGDRVAPTFSARTWYYQDERGSVIAAEDGTGTPRINRYDDYGVPGGSNSGRFQYTGQFWLAEPSIYYYKARFYDPKLGLFLQTDPKGYDAGENLYAYVGDDPMNKADPTGLQSCKDAKGPCPNVPLPSKEDRDTMRPTVGRASRTGGSERGAQMFRNPKSGETRIVTGRKAGRGSSGEFHFKPNRRAGEVNVMDTHLHNGSDEKGTHGAAQTLTNNAPSEQDQEALNQCGCAHQIVGPDVSGTLYRQNRQDYFQVEEGNIKDVPNLKDQHIIVLPPPTSE